MLSEITIFLWNHKFSQKITNGQMKSQRVHEITAKRHQEITTKKRPQEITAVIQNHTHLNIIILWIESLNSTC